MVKMGEGRRQHSGGSAVVLMPLFKQDQEGFSKVRAASHCPTVLCAFAHTLTAVCCSEALF